MPMSTSQTRGRNESELDICIWRCYNRAKLLQWMVEMGSQVGLVETLSRIVGLDGILYKSEDRLVYSRDGSNTQSVPDVVVFPATPQQVASVLQVATEMNVPVVPWGAGTGLCGGAVAVRGGVIVATSRMQRIVEVDTANRFAIVEAGVVNLDLANAVARLGYTYAPDPSSQPVCTIGGNVATNAGGPHCLAYGVTVNHILGVQVALEDGRLVWFGGPRSDVPGYDLRALFVGSEGTLGIVTQVCVRLMQPAAAVRTFLALFASLEDASRAVSGILGRGIIPAALEMMDALAIQAVESHMHVGYPKDAEAVLLIELEGMAEEMDTLADRVSTICQQAGAIGLRLAQTTEERLDLWKGRKNAVGSYGSIAPNYYLQDGTVPLSRLPEMMTYVERVAAKYGLSIANVFHAGDGNLHPTFLFDSREEGILEKVHQAGAEILHRCVEVGGTISGEHGIGMEKVDYMSWLFNDDDLQAMMKARRALSPGGLLNPGKIMPQASLI